MSDPAHGCPGICKITTKVTPIYADRNFISLLHNYGSSFAFVFVEQYGGCRRFMTPFLK